MACGGVYAAKVFSFVDCALIGHYFFLFEKRAIWATAPAKGDAGHIFCHDVDVEFIFN
jgi:hypothetical protein